MKLQLRPEFVIGAVVVVLFAVGWLHTAPEIPVASDYWQTEVLEPGPFTTHWAGERTLPDSQKTPGARYREATLEKIQEDGYSASVRDVTDATKKKVFEEYSIPWADHAQYEVDHLIPLCIGGSNELSNLWPQPYAGTWGARVKDNVERHALAAVRAKQISLKAAQDGFAHDWTELYKTLVGAKPKEAMTAAYEQ